MSGGNFFVRLVNGMLGDRGHAQAIQKVERRNDHAASITLLDEFLEQHTHRWSGSLDLKATEAGRRITELDDNARIGLLFAALAYATGNKPVKLGVAITDRAQEVFKISSVRKLISYLLRRPSPIEQKDLVLLVDSLSGSNVQFSLPVRSIIGAAAKRKETDGELIPDLREALSRVAGRMRARPQRHQHAVHRKTLQTIEEILREGAKAPVALNLTAGEAWSDAALADLGRMTPQQRNAWADLLHYAQLGKGSKPTKKWLAGAGEKITAVGKEEFCSRVSEWFLLVGRPRSQELPPPGPYHPDANLLLIEPHVEILKGLAWCCSGIDDARLARAVGTAAVAAYKKVPWQGPMCKKLANAAVVALSSMPGVEPVAQLGRLNTQVKHASARKYIARRMEDVAARTGQTAADLAESAIPTFDLDSEGKRRVSFAEFTAEIAVTGSTDVAVHWFAASGKQQKSIPAELKRDHAPALKELQRTAKDIGKMLPAQRTRIERLLMTRRQWPLAVWQARYLNQPLLSNLSRRLIWEFNSGSDWGAGALLNGTIVSREDRPIAVGEKAEVRLWHPIDGSPEEIGGWRAWLEKHEITQPFKQAHREVYVVTDAERATDTYSNRFAGHILRQHQFAALCQARGWEYRLQGAFDSHNSPTLELPEHHLRVQFWVDPVEENQTSDAGIFLHVSTDQVRFCRGDEAIAVAQVSPLLFTEIMRDVDLFVGVASVGNDPNWRDMGQRPEFNQYWQRTSFGELTETAKTRKAVLERLVPKLKHAERFSFSDKFLLVRGDIHTYKIHLGSGNILMEPHGQYLCIVPARGGTDPAGGLFLPFEGDGTLSIIISKAMMLAEDRKIKDPSIRSQIGG
jgi:hypothetical protein